MSTATPSAGLSGHHVFLQLAARESGLGPTGSVSGIGSGMHNRIALKADSITISSSKTIPSMSVPFSGMITGESTNVGLDLGMCVKTISISGIITEQTITKAFPLNSIDTLTTASGHDLTRSSTSEKTTSDNFDVVTVDMTAHEVAQLIHSYVDSSMIQRQQNLNELIILFPSYVSKYWLYHNDTIATASTRTVDSGIMLPFSWAVRDVGKEGAKLDNHMAAAVSTFPTEFNTTDNEASGLSGFIRSFSTPWVGGQPHVEFSLDFEVAFIPMG